MAYEVLARKWRPDRFATMVGQEHVLRALIHALEADRLHHAYLFTGTRGVGKTTVARILARCLNCERGVGPEPCGECSSCVEISEGRFVDLIEVDAASRTKVEDTRELLDNVQYAPTRGRYKVYLIDEVHMLSASSFNALLKTLEEPPPHVKFLLATTDPKKLPVTVLSRCLQFHLKNLTPERIVGHLQHVLEAEGIEFDDPALWALARGADGSMRDALSLTDQAISHGGGRLVAEDVARMLGTIDQGALERILQALAAGDGEALIHCSDDLAAHAADFSAVLKDLMSALHELALGQSVPGHGAGGEADARGDAMSELAQRIAPEDVQLYYQISLTGLRDLPWAPDPRVGFEMTLLRMLAFRPDPGGGAEPPPTGGGATRGSDTNAPDASSAGGQQAGTQESVSGAAAVSARAPALVTGSASVAIAAAWPERAATPSTPASPETQLARTAVDPSPAAATHAVAATAEAVAPAATRAADRVPDQFPDSHGGALASAPAQVASTPSQAEDRGHAGTGSSSASASDADVTAATIPATTTDADTDAETDAKAAPTPVVSRAHVMPEPEPESEPNARAAPARAASTQDDDGPAATRAAEPVMLLIPDDWHLVLSRISLQGLTSELAAHCLPSKIDGERVDLVLDMDAESLLADIHVTRLEAALGELLGTPRRVRIEPGRPAGETPAQRAARERAERQQRAEQAIAGDLHVRRMQEVFNASLQHDTIRPLS